MVVVVKEAMFRNSILGTWCQTTDHNIRHWYDQVKILRNQGNCTWRVVSVRLRSSSSTKWWSCPVLVGGSELSLGVFQTSPRTEICMHPYVMALSPASVWKGSWMACGSENDLLPACEFNIRALDVLNAYGYYGLVRCGTSDLLYFLLLSSVPPSGHLLLLFPLPTCPLQCLNPLFGKFHFILGCTGI